MKWSFSVGRMLGTDIYLHATLPLLLVFLGFVTWRSSGQVDAALAGVVLLGAVFGCVLLHELGHALAARKYGIKTSNITLLPIGGIARLERMPDQPEQELRVALAGPAVNLAIAALLFLWLAFSGGLASAEVLGLTSGSVVQQLLAINLALFAFNLLPAFPMDGGRVLRALLATHLDRRRATAIAARFGQGMAILFGVAGVLYSLPLLFVAVFVFLGAQSEAGLMEMRPTFRCLCVRDAMSTQFRTLSPLDTVGQLAEERLASSHRDFPVMSHGRTVGILRHEVLLEALTASRETTVAGIMSPACDPVDEAASLQPTVESMQRRHWASAPVVRGDRIVGLLTVGNVNEMLMINASGPGGRSLRRGRRPHPSSPGSRRIFLPAPKPVPQPS